MIALWLRYATRCQCRVPVWHVSGLKNLKRSQCPTSWRLWLSLDRRYGYEINPHLCSVCVWNTKENTCEGFVNAECWDSQQSPVLHNYSVIWQTVKDVANSKLKSSTVQEQITLVLQSRSSTIKCHWNDYLFHYTVQLSIFYFGIQNHTISRCRIPITLEVRLIVPIFPKIKSCY